MDSKRLFLKVPGQKKFTTNSALWIGRIKTNYQSKTTKHKPLVEAMSLTYSNYFFLNG